MNGKEALVAVETALKQQASYNLICLDILMPEMDGQAALVQIRAIEETFGRNSSQGAKVIMTTGLTDLKNVAKAFHSLCDGYLTKPFDGKRLIEELKRLSLISVVG